jgi:zinc transporter 5/7
MIFLSVLPLLKDSAMTLLLQTPSNIQYEILDRILKLDNVLSYSDEHFWNLSSSNIVGTIHIQISNDGDEQRVTTQVSFLFSVIFLKLFSSSHLGTNNSERSSDAKYSCSSRKTSIF